MKKIAIAAITATSILALSACSSGDKEVIAKTDAGDVTKGELYTNMKKTAGASVLTQLVQEKVLDKKYKVSDKEIDNKLKEYKTQTWRSIYCPRKAIWQGLPKRTSKI